MMPLFDRRTLSSLALIAAVIAGLYLCFLMAAPFLPAIVCPSSWPASCGRCIAGFARPPETMPFRPA